MSAANLRERLHYAGLDYMEAKDAMEQAAEKMRALSLLAMHDGMSEREVSKALGGAVSNVAVHGWKTKA